MNERLQFSWGHIIAFIALIALSYFSFMGFTYLTNGNFAFALIGMGLTDIVFIIFFIGAQQMKASGYHMRKKIIWERIFIFGSPLVFIAGMIAISHFWTVHSRNDEIVSTFTQSINSSRQLFTDYEDYAERRIKSYEQNLNRIIANRATDPKSFAKAGFEDSKATVQRDNMVETLRLQLLSQNYDTLRNTANRWIDNASHGVSTWNVFLLGNTREIKEALANWEKQLGSFSKKRLSNEEMAGKVADFHSDGAIVAIAGIDGLTSAFTAQKFPTIPAIIFGIVTYLMLLFPYFLQDRHTKNVYRLGGNESSENKKNAGKSKIKMSKPSSHKSDDFKDEAPAVGLHMEEDNDFPTF